MSPRQRAEQIADAPTLVDLITTAIQAACNEELERGRARMADAKAALQAALEDLARVKAERDHVAGKLAGCKECGGSGYVVSYAYDGYPEGTPCDHGNVLASHDRAVAARVLREAEGYIVEPIECSTLLRLADQYERGEREVPA